MAKKRMLDEVLSQAGREENLSEADRAEIESEREFRRRMDGIEPKEEAVTPVPEVVTAAPAPEAPKGEEKGSDGTVAETEDPGTARGTEPATVIVRGIETLPILNDEEKDRILTDRLREILGRTKPKGALPTLVRYHQDGLAPLRAVIIDIGDAELKEGWEFYKANVSSADPEAYLLKVYSLTQKEIPRLYRAVGELMLE